MSKTQWRCLLSFYFLKHVWDQLFSVDTIWSIGETGDIYTALARTDPQTRRSSLPRSIGLNLDSPRQRLWSRDPDSPKFVIKFHASYFCKFVQIEGILFYIEGWVECTFSRERSRVSPLWTLPKIWGKSLTRRALVIRTWHRMLHFRRDLFWALK